jgi:sugar phosphate permease
VIQSSPNPDSIPEAPVSLKPDALKPGTIEADTRAAACLKRRWIYVLPAAFVTYSLAYLDRANYGFGAAAGLAETLHITEAQTSLLGALFFLGYFIFQIPGATFARKRSARWLVFAALIVWGTLAALTGVIRHFWLLAIDRFLLGIAESFILPSMMLLLTRWFTRSERSRANALLILGNPVTVLWMSAITGYLIQVFGWQKTFIIEGIPSVLWAIVWIFIIHDHPSQAGWLGHEAAELLEQRLNEEQVTIEPVKSVRQALMRKDVLLLSVQYFAWSIGVYGFVLWLPTIIRHGASLSMGQTGLLSAIPYLAAIILMVVVSHLSDKSLNRQKLVWPFLLLAGFGMLGSFFLADISFTAAFLCLIVAGGGMYAPYGPFFAIIPERLPSNVTAEVLALVNSSGALGAFVGSYLVGLLEAVTHSSRPGFLLMSLSLIASALLTLALPRTAQQTAGQN